MVSFSHQSDTTAHFIPWDHWEVCASCMPLQVRGRPGYHQDSCSLQCKYGHAAVMELAAKSGFLRQSCSTQTGCSPLPGISILLLPLPNRRVDPPASERDQQRGGDAQPVTTRGREGRGWTYKAWAKKPAPQQIMLPTSKNMTRGTHSF